MTETEKDILVIVIGFPLFAVGFWLWFNAAKNMWGLLHNYKPNRDWGRYIPFSIFLPSFFTDQGNVHRKAMLKYSGLFIVFVGTPFLIAGIWELLS